MFTKWMYLLPLLIFQDGVFTAFNSNTIEEQYTATKYKLAMTINDAFLDAIRDGFILAKEVEHNLTQLLPLENNPEGFSALVKRINDLKDKNNAIHFLNCSINEEYIQMNTVKEEVLEIIKSCTLEVDQEIAELVEEARAIPAYAYDNLVELRAYWNVCVGWFCNTRVIKELHDELEAINKFTVTLVENLRKFEDGKSAMNAQKCVRDTQINQQVEIITRIVENIELCMGKRIDE